MNPKAVAGITGVVGLTLVGYIGSRYSSVHTRAKRDLLLQGNSDDYDLSVDEDFETDFVDEWSDDFENATDLWKQFNKDVGIELTDDDVQLKQERRGGGKRPNYNRFKENQLPNMYPHMAKEYASHLEALSFFNEISGIKMGQRDPSEFGSTMDDEGDYTGYHRTAPVVSNFLNAFECSGDGKSNFAAGGKTNLWVLFPGAVPLFSDSGKHISDWSQYWEFFVKFAAGWPNVDRRTEFRFSLGTYSTTTRFTPRGYKLRNNTPFARMQRYYKKPAMNAARPKIFSTLRSMLTYIPRYGVSTPSAGDNCIVMWFFQDVPRDLNDFLVPEEFEMISELHSMCTLLPIIVGPNANSAEWQNFAANLMPGLQTKFAKDPDFNGVFHVNSFAELTSDDLMSHVNNYLCLVQNRATCRTVVDAWLPPASDSATGADPTEGFRAVVEDYDSTDAPAGTETAGFTTDAGSTAEPTTAKVPEIDSCCGHDGTVATPFDSELRTCCEDGVVRAYEYEGDDPCLSASDFFK